MNPDFALLVPAYNGGALLEATLRSCLAPGFDPARVVVIVSDNGSDDGSYERALELAAGSGGRLHVHRNESNLGRVGNWNRCLERAEAMGAAYGTFLMVGDEWLPGADPRPLTDAMRACGAPLALARYRIVEADGRPRRIGRLFIRDASRVVRAREFVRRALSSAALCFGPLQANVYRLDGPRRVRFDADDPTHTDQRATLEFLADDDVALVLWGEPYFAWKAHAGRFHMRMDVRKRVGDDFRLIDDAAAARALPLDANRVNAALFLINAREFVGQPGGWTRVREIAEAVRSRPGGLPWDQVAGQLVRRVVFRRFFA